MHQLVDRLADSLQLALFPDRACPMFVRSDRNGADESALEIDACDFSGQAGTFRPRLSG
jgi:hypothetical protein